MLTCVNETQQCHFLCYHIQTLIHIMTLPLALQRKAKVLVRSLTHTGGGGTADDPEQLESPRRLLKAKPDSSMHP